MTASVFDRVENLLKEHGIAFQVLRHEPVYTSEEAARIRGTPLRRLNSQPEPQVRPHLPATYFLPTPTITSTDHSSLGHRMAR